MRSGKKKCGVFFVNSCMHPLMLLLPLLSFLLAVSCVSGAPGDAEVTQFPGFEGPLLSKHYAGYITIGNEDHRKHMYYYFATSERNPLEDPLVLWINGGPGCSGLCGLVQINGPFMVDYKFIRVRDQTKIIANPYSWTKVSNIIYVDSPVGTGYSYSDKSEDHVTNDTQSVSDLYEFLLQWFFEYPEFLSNSLYLAASSYSGVIAPVLAQSIVNGIEDGIEPTLNFKGFTLSNAAIDIDLQIDAQVPFAYRMGLISEELYKDLESSCGGKYWNNDCPDCLRNLEIYQRQTEAINKEHILCRPCHNEMGLSMDIDEYESVQMYQSLHGKIDQYNIHCHNYEMLPKRLFDSETARQKLHAKSVDESGEWFRCKKFSHYERDILHLAPYYLNVTRKGIRIYLNSGDHDMVLPFTATLGLIRRLNFTEIEKWRPWFVDDQIAGYTVRFDHNILFATFKGAGHNVPEFMPREALIAYQKWIDGAESL